MSCGPGHGGRLDDGGLGVVLVVERAHGPTRLEAPRERRDVVVHLRPALLAVVDDVEARLLQKLDGVRRRPVVDLREGQAAGAKTLDELVVAVHLEPLAPPLGLGEVVLFERPVGERLHAPGRLGQAADLAGEEANAQADTRSSLVARRGRARDRRASRARSSRGRTGGRRWARARSPQDCARPTARRRSRSRRGLRAPSSGRRRHRRGLARVVLGHRLERRAVEVDAHRGHGRVGQLVEHGGGISEDELQGERNAGRQLAQRLDSLGGATGASQERLGEDDERAARFPPRLDLRREHVGRQRPGTRAPVGRAGQGVRRRERRHPASGWKVGADSGVRRRGSPSTSRAR